MKYELLKTFSNKTCQYFSQTVGNLHRTGAHFHIPGFKLTIMAERDNSLVSKADALNFIKSISTQVNVGRALGISQSYVSKNIK